MPAATSYLPGVPAILLLAVACVTPSGVVPSGVAAAADAGQQLFEADLPLAVTIAAPLRAVQDERDSGEYHDGALSYSDADGEQRVLDLKLRARGRYRRQPSTCRFPPIRLNFKKSQLDGSVFAGQDKLKLVTHCRTGSERFEQLLLKEYLAYRLFATLTEFSFSTRLLRVTWRDSEDPEENFEHYAFVIEDEELLGERIGMPPAEVRSSKVSRLDAPHAALVGLFEYLIGNTDFSMLAGPKDEHCCHNVVLYDNDGRHVPIPYDFDFAGIVNAPYAAPNPKLRIKSVTTRLYRGRCEHNELLPQALAVFREKRGDLLALIERQEGLSGRTRKGLERYVEGFFTIVDSPRQVERRLIGECL